MEVKIHYERLYTQAEVDTKIEEMRRKTFRDAFTAVWCLDCASTFEVIDVDKFRYRALTELETLSTNG